MNETTNPVAKVTGEWRKKMGMTYRSFADALNEHLVNTGISHTSVANWEKGITEPGTDFLLTCLVVHEDWRVEWAIECLCAKLPEVFDRYIDGRLIVLTNRVVAYESVAQAA